MYKLFSKHTANSIIALAIFGAFCISAGGAWAASYQVRVPANIKAASAPEIPKEEIQVFLESASLPAAMAGKAYEYDFSP